MLDNQRNALGDRDMALEKLRGRFDSQRSYLGWRFDSQRSYLGGLQDSMNALQVANSKLTKRREEEKLTHTRETAAAVTQKLAAEKLVGAQASAHARENAGLEEQVKRLARELAGEQRGMVEGE